MTIVAVGSRHPLTPALSRGEREAASAPVRTTNDQGSPLPPGEGQGEGLR
jgi:hypothetical protein